MKYGRKPVDIFGIKLDALTLEQAAERIAIECVTTDQLHYVVTPNIDHIVNLDNDLDFKTAYENASYTLADGWPVVVAARLMGQKIPERVAGSDLVPRILKYAEFRSIPLSVFILGGIGNVPERAAEYIQQEFPSLRVAGYYSPPLGFERDERACHSIVEMICHSRANFIIVGLGAPKQEKWIDRHRKLLPHGIAVCAGATVDFMAGNVKRAPHWMARLGLEWLHRLASDPRRLARRYARDAVVFPFLFLRELLRGHRDKTH